MFSVVNQQSQLDEEEPEIYGKVLDSCYNHKTISSIFIYKVFKLPHLTKMHKIKLTSMCFAYYTTVSGAKWFFYVTLLLPLPTLPHQSGRKLRVNLSVD